MIDFRLRLLQQKGYRITHPRQQILKALTTYPQSAKEILDRTKTKTIDLATVYRTLEFFLQADIIHTVTFDEKSIMYELNRENNHHHHMVCEKCKKVTDITVEDTDFLKKILKGNNFTLQRHTLELFGLCSNCK